LGAFGQRGVERVLDLMQAELVMVMKQAGTTAISKITSEFAAIGVKLELRAGVRAVLTQFL
jgi:isopentenyl diphosphate isomerase/L-lactate dehydrogenase-like FMN-dependent dehydrogenase